MTEIESNQGGNASSTNFYKLLERLQWQFDFSDKNKK